MASIKPFCGTRYNSKKYSVPPVCPPYDIISEDARQRLAKDHFNMINLDKPGSDDDPARYQKSAERFAAWKKDGVLIREDKPSFYVYAEHFKHPETGEECERTGFFALVKLEPHYENAIFPHERTLAAPKVDRLNLMRTTRAHLSPVFGLYNSPGNHIQTLLHKVKSGKPLFEAYKDLSGTEHFLWRVSDAATINDLVAALAEQKVIIADGHHRYETAWFYRNEMKKSVGAGFKPASPEGEMPYDYVLMCLVNFNDAGLIILPTHRLFSIDVDWDVIMDKLQRFFTIEAAAAADIEQALLNKRADVKQLGLYRGAQRKNYILTLRPDRTVLHGIVPESKSADWRTLEVNLLYYVIIKHIIEMTDENFENKITYSHSFTETMTAVDSGAARFAFLLPSCSKHELDRVTAAEEVMPQKSTYFFPKVFSGFVMYDHE